MLKRAPKLYFLHYLCVSLFRSIRVYMDQYLYPFCTYPFRKLVLSLFLYFAFCVSWKMASHLCNYCLPYISFTFFSHCSICKNLGNRVIFYYKSSKKHASWEVLKNVEDSLNERVKKRKFLRKPFFWNFCFNMTLLISR